MNKMKAKPKIIAYIICAMIVLSVTSCIDGFKDDSMWSPSVTNATMNSPVADEIKVKFNADNSEQTIEWPLVKGAGGYQVSVYNIDNPDSPVLIGEENQVVDGISVKREAKEDSRYKVVIKTLGNERYNNKDAATATAKEYDNLLSVTAVIPSGTNLTEYFTTNPVPVSATELCYELEPGGSYTMSGNVSIGQTSVTFRGSKLEHAKLKMTDGSFVNGGAGLKLKFIDIDYADFVGAATNSLILMDANFDATAAAASSNGTSYLVVPTTKPVAIQSCKITGLKYYLFYDNGKKYAIGSLMIKDCIIGQNSSTFNQATLRFQSGMVKDMSFINSTFYNEIVPNSSNRICQISSGNVSSVKPVSESWTGGSITITNCTFWQFPKGAQSFNSNGAMGTVNDKIIIRNNIIIDSGEYASAAGGNGFIKRFRRGNTTATFTGGGNTFWYNGAVPEGEISGTSADTSGDYILTNPQLTYQGNGVFTMAGPDQISRGTGDPRWLPGSTIWH